MAKAAHIDVDDIGLGVETEVPNLLQQHLARHHVTGVLHQQLQDLELFRRQGQVDTLAMGGARFHRAVRYHRTTSPRCGHGCATGATGRGHGRSVHDLRTAAEIVVGAAFQALGAIFAARQGDSIRMGVLMPASRSRFMIDRHQVRQHAVQHDEVVGVQAGLRPGPCDRPPPTSQQSRPSARPP